MLFDKCFFIYEFMFCFLSIIFMSEALMNVSKQYFMHKHAHIYICMHIYICICTYIYIYKIKQNV